MRSYINRACTTHVNPLIMVLYIWGWKFALFRIKTKNKVLYIFKLMMRIKFGNMNGSTFSGQNSWCVLYQDNGSISFYLMREQVRTVSAVCYTKKKICSCMFITEIKLALSSSILKVNSVRDSWNLKIHFYIRKNLPFLERIRENEGIQSQNV